MLNEQNTVHILKSFLLLTVIAQSKARNTFAHSSTGIVVLNPIPDIVVCVLYLGSDLASG
jgi:hypothetical protein